MIIKETICIIYTLMNDDKVLCRRVLDLLAYGNIHLSLDTTDNQYLYKKLCLCSGLTSYDGRDYVPDTAALEKLTGPERLLSDFPENIRDRLIAELLPAPSKLIELFNSVLEAGDITDAADWLYDLGVKSGYIPLSASENNIHWRPEGAKGGLHITINTSVAYDNGCHYDYPRCLSCEGPDGGLLMRELPVFIRDEDWFFRFSPNNLFRQHFAFYPRNHTAGKTGAETYARLIDAVEYFPHYFFAANARPDGGKGMSHECFYGGLPELPLFSAPPRIAFDDPDCAAKVTVPDWYNTVIRLESSNRRPMITMTEKISAAWQKEGGGISPILRINGDGEYCAELILRNNKLPAYQGLIVPAGGLGVLESAGVFILPKETARVAEAAYALLSGGSDDVLEKLRDDKELLPYAEVITDIKAKSSGNPANAEADIESYIETACEEALRAGAAFKEDAAGNMALINFMTSLGLTVKR